MATKRANAPSSATPGMSPRDQTWHHYASVMEKFRKLCNPDSGLFKQAENRIRAKRVVEAWESQGRPFADAVNPFRLSQKMDELVLDLEDERQVDDLYRAKLAFRDRLCAALGKGDTEGWDVFHDRHSTSAKIPNVVKQFELAGKHVPLAKPAITTHGLAPEGRK